MLPLLLFSHGAPAQKRITLNTGAQMPLLNLGGTSPDVAAGDHYSNYSAFLRQGGRAPRESNPNLLIHAPVPGGSQFATLCRWHRHCTDLH